jgi:hypothetical protein
MVPKATLVKAEPEDKMVLKEPLASKASVELRVLQERMVKRERLVQKEHKVQLVNKVCEDSVVYKVKLVLRAWMARRVNLV